MTDENGSNSQSNDPNNHEGKPIGDGKAEQTNISLSQAILGPLDAIFKAQLHGTRSFLNMLLQLGYRGLSPEEKSDDSIQKADGTPFVVKFNAGIKQDGQEKKYQISVPALALVPIQPIAINSAEYEMEMTVRQIFKHRQMQESRIKTRPMEDERKRPWYLVRQPISIRGVLAAPVEPPLEDDEEGKLRSRRFQGSTIKVKVKVDKTPIPAGLSKLLTGLTEMSKLREENP